MATTRVHDGRRGVRLHKRQAPGAATFFTSSLPLLQQDQALSLASGYLPARPPAGGKDAADDAHLYFVLERARHMGNKRRLIIWFNGGPGCSSFDGLMMEVGAFRPDTRGGLEWTKAGGAWNEYADVLYLDQPVGTGFSYVNTNGYARSLEQAADEVVYFLKKLVEVYPEYAKGNGADVYLAGESYAGQYIPFTAAAILKQGHNTPIDLRGIAIGNGFIDPKAQGGTELEKMVQAKVWTEKSENYKAIKKDVDQCRKDLDAETGDARKVTSCNNILPSIIERTKATTGNRETCINIYDVRLSDTAPACGMNWPPTLKATYDYLARDDVRRALHVDSVHKPEAWVECSHRVGAGIESDIHGKAAVVHLPYILEQQVPVLLFAGDKDLICNDIGVERVAERLQWGGEGWGTPAKKEWFVDQQKAGYWRTNRNLTYVSVADASHMVGVDKPVEGHDMMLRFMGVDLMAAAGPSARIPSRLEGETDRAVIVGGGGVGGGSTNGGSAAQDNRPMLPGVSGKTEEQVAEEAKWAAYYNAGSAALIVLLILIGAGTCILLRLRRRARLLRRGGGGGGSAPFLDANEDGREHEMDRFIPGRGRSTDNLSEDEETTYSDNTLDATTVSNTLANGRRAEAARKSADTQNSVAHRDAEQIFDVGVEDSDDDDIGNAAAHRTSDAVRFAA